LKTGGGVEKSRAKIFQPFTQMQFPIEY